MVLQVHQGMCKKPIFTIKTIADSLEITRPTVTSALETLEEMKIIRELTGRQRDRVFVYDQFLSILNEGTEAVNV